MLDHQPLTRAHQQPCPCPALEAAPLTQAAHVTQVPEVVGPHQREQHVVVLLALVLVGGGVSARQVTALDDGWRFLRADVAGAGATVFDDSVWAVVRLPHTWNGIDGEAGGAYYRGPGWYRRELQMPAAELALRHFLQFDGAALRATVAREGAAALFRGVTYPLATISVQVTAGSASAVL